jgi:redox-sensitive bicupin YhaK (pirin superfamily)
MTESQAIDQSRSVARVADSVEMIEGVGFRVRRSFPTRTLDHFDPFLLLDEFGPLDLGPGEAKGIPDHPHRGFETVTYMLAGQMEHRDSQGNEGRLGPGDVQWMTAGAGVVHSEMPAAEFKEEGGRVHGFQLWVNLPRRDKMMRPRYQEVAGESLPVASSADGKVTVKVIAGEALGARAVIDTRTPMSYLHYTAAPGARIWQPVVRDHNVLAYVVDGEGRLGRESRPVSKGQVALFAQDGDGVSITAAQPSAVPLALLLIAGAPLGEPVVRRGPFVMTSEEEIRQAIEDYQSGRMGKITAAP